MTISNQVVKRLYQADGTTRAWEVDFPVLADGTVAAFVTDGNGTVTQVTQHYAWNAQNHTFTYPTEASGLSPLAVGTKITLLRQTPLTQQTDLVRQDAWDAEVLEEGYDKLTCLAQELNEKISRAVQVPVGKTGETNAENFVTVSALSSGLAGKQDTLSTAQQNAVNSGITAALVAKISTNESNISSLQSNKLDASTASAAYLAQTDAASTYLTQTNAASAYLSQTNAANTYLTKTDAASTYATQTSLTSGLAGKQDTLTTAQLSAVNSGVTASTVSQVQTNKNNIEALDAELDENRPWVKPSDWMDIRSMSLPESAYFLVGHSSDYSTYPEFTVNTTVADSGTYDIYIDGVKKVSAVSSGTSTTLNWQTLALTTGYDVTHPAALRTHIVRVTPSDSSKTLTALHLAANSSVNQGVLWGHFSISNMSTINLRYLFGDENQTYKCPVLEAVTSSTDTIGGGMTMFMNCESLVTIPTVIKGFSGNTLVAAFRNTALKKIHFKDCNLEPGYFTFAQASQLKKITSENSVLAKMHNSIFAECPALEEIDVPISFANTTSCTNLFSLGGKLKGNLFLDASNGDSVTRLSLGGDSTHLLRAIKGLVVSANAPFSSSDNGYAINISYTGLDRAALVALFNSLSTVTDSQVCNITGATGAADLTADDLAIATAKGWSITR